MKLRLQLPVSSNWVRTTYVLKGGVRSHPPSICSTCHGERRKPEALVGGRVAVMGGEEMPCQATKQAGVSHVVSRRARSR